MTAATPVAPTGPARTTTARVGHVALWALQILLALVFVVGSAAPKFFGEAYAVQIFAEIGVGQWFRYVVGALELVGGIGVLVPRAAGAAAVGLIGVMVGATAAQLVLLDTGFWYTPVILGVLLAMVVVARRHEVRASFARRQDVSGDSPDTSSR
jgi:putative oxidoreductase